MNDYLSHKKLEMLPFSPRYAADISYLSETKPLPANSGDILVSLGLY